MNLRRLYQIPTPKDFKWNTKGLGECPTVLLKVYCTAGEEIGVEVASARQVVDVLLALKNNKVTYNST